MKLINYMLSVLIINIIGFGGAPLTVGYYRTLFVEKGYITEKELNNYVAFGNLLPGAMSFYVSGYIGRKLYGKKGVIIGIAMCTFPIMVVTIVFYNLIKYFDINTSSLIIIILPIIIINSINQFRVLLKKKMDKELKWFLFVLSLILLLILSVSSFQLILLFIIFILLFSTYERITNVS